MATAGRRGIGNLILQDIRDAIAIIGQRRIESFPLIEHHRSLPLPCHLRGTRCVISR
jgi:hypothetical protein